MRIITGIFKGRKILKPLDISTRPLKDLTKESIFNIIQHSNKFNINLENSYILDLFSGVGSFGIECLSRGSKFVIFVENYKGVLPVLNKNLKNLQLTKNYLIIEKDIMNNFNFNSLNHKFDIIFLDPPFKDEGLSIIIDKIFNSKVLKDNGILILHRNFKSNDALSKNFNVLEKKKYGLSKIIFGNFN